MKKYIQFIKEQIDIDPLGEEEWDDDDLPPVLHIARKQNISYDKITRLNCSGSQLTSLKGIENLINLRILYCSDNNLTSLEEIKNLINLKYIDCSNNQLNLYYKLRLRLYCKRKNIILIY